MKMERG